MNGLTYCNQVHSETLQKTTNQKVKTHDGGMMHYTICIPFKPDRGGR